LTTPPEDILLVSLAQRASLRPVAFIEPATVFGDDLMPIIITTIGFSIFVNHDGDPSFHCFTK
jgi:hypothetical protein